MGVDIRKSLFYTLAEKNWPLLGLEAVGMSLEDIFISIVDQSSAKNRYVRKETKKSGGRAEIEKDIAKRLVDEAAKNRSRASSVFEDADDKNN